MPTIIDSLIVTLNLDPSNFNKAEKEAAAAFLKTRDAAKGAGDDIETASKRGADSIDRVTKSALGLFAVLLGADSLKDFVVGITQTDAAVGRLSNNLGVSARNLQAWQAAFQRAGGTAEGASSSTSTANSQLQNARINGGMVPTSIARLFADAGMGSQLGQDIASGDTQKYMLDLAQAYRITAQKQGAPTAAYLLSQGGYDPTFGNVALQHGGAGMQGYLNSMPTVSDSTIKQMQETQDKFVAIQQDLVTNAATIVGDIEKDIAPMIDEFKTQVDDLTSATGPMVKDVQQFAAAIGNLMKMLAPFLPALDSSDVGGDLRKNVTTWWGGIAAEVSNTAAGNGSTGVSQGPGMRPRANGRPTGALSLGSSAAPNPSNASRIAYLRQIAIANGIDPDTFVRVASSEGLGGLVGDDNSSFGDFQLHYGGVSGQFPHAGLGDEFTSQTGLDARDKTTWQQQAQWVAQRVRQHGWGDWSGARAQGITGFSGVGQMPWWSSMSRNAVMAGAMGRGAQAFKGSTITIHGGVTVHTQAKDAQGIASAIVPALKRSALAQQANYGPS